MGLIDKTTKRDNKPRLSNEADSKSESVSYNRGVSFSKDEIELIMYLIQESMIPGKKLKETLSKSQSTYHFKQRQSRPRAQENIINPKMKGI